MKLGGIVAPEMEYNHPDKGDALYAMELALSLEVKSLHSGLCQSILPPQTTAVFLLLDCADCKPQCRMRKWRQVSMSALPCTL